MGPIAVPEVRLPQLLYSKSTFVYLLRFFHLPLSLSTPSSHSLFPYFLFAFFPLPLSFQPYPLLWIHFCAFNNLSPFPSAPPFSDLPSFLFLFFLDTYSKSNLVYLLRFFDLLLFSVLPEGLNSGRQALTSTLCSSKLSIHSSSSCLFDTNLFIFHAQLYQCHWST